MTVASQTKLTIGLLFVGAACLALGIYSIFYRSEPVPTSIITTQAETQKAAEPQAKSYIQQIESNRWKVVVDGTARWFNTTIGAEKAARLELHASGQVVWNPDNPTWLNLHGTVNPNGTRLPDSDNETFPMKSAGMGALIMRIGNIKYAVGTDSNIKVKETGEIEFMINDDDLSDNSGSFTVYIKR
jgi:hypothetical protein